MTTSLSIGPEKPIANRTRSAASSPSVPGTGFSLAVDARVEQLRDLAALARKTRRRDRVLASWRPRPGSTRRAASAASAATSESLVSFSGGLGMISSCVTDLAPWRIDVPMQSEPVSPPPMTMTCLSLALISLVLLASGFAGDAAVLLRQEIHREMQAVEIAARRLREEVERPLGAAGEQHGVVAVLDLVGRHVLADVARRDGTSRPRPSSARCGARPPSSRA